MVSLYMTIKISAMDSEFNSYFSSVGQNLVDDLIKNNKNTNVCDFKTYCPRSIINSIFITPTDEYEILGIIYVIPKPLDMTILAQS